MTTKNRKSIWLVSLLVLVAAVALFLCLRGRRNYTWAIPKNASVVAALNLKTMVKERKASDMADVKGLKNSGLEPVVKAFLSDESGLDYGSKAYAFATKQGDLILLLKADDEDKVAENLMNLSRKGVAKALKDKHNCRFFLLYDKVLVAVSSEAVLLTAPVLPQDVAQKQNALARLMRQKRDKSFVSNARFSALEEAKTAFLALIRYELMPHGLQEFLSLHLPKGLNSKELWYEMRSSVSDSSIILLLNATSEESKDERLLEDYKQKQKPLSSDLLEGLPEGCLMFASAAKGEELASFVRQTKPLAEMLFVANTAVDFGTVLSSVGSGFAVTVDGDLLSDGGDISQNGAAQYAFQAKLNGFDLDENIRQWQQGEDGGKFRKLSPAAYEYTNGGSSLLLSMQKGGLFRVSGSLDKSPKSGSDYATLLQNGGKTKAMAVLDVDRLLLKSQSLKPVRSIFQKLLTDKRFVVLRLE